MNTTFRPWPMVLVTIAFAAVLALYGGSLPRAGIDIDLHPGFQEAARGGWNPVFSMDLLSAKDVQMPYAGWPVLHPLAVCLLGKAGLNYWAASLIIAGASALLTVWFLSRCLRMAGVQCPPVIPAAVLLFSPGLWVSMGSTFAHIFIPLGAALSLADLVRHAALHERGGKISPAGWILTFAGGILAGSMNWACFMVIPAAAIAALASQRRVADPAARRAFRGATLRWMFVHGFGMVTAFLIFKGVQHMVVHSPDSLSLEHSGSMARFVERTAPTIKNLTGMAFFNGCRIVFVLLPLIPLALLAFRQRKTAGVPGSGLAARMLFWTALFSPVVFSLIFSGEIAQSAHTFHGRLWVVPAAVCASFLAGRFARPPVVLVAASAALVMVLSIFGYKILGPIVCANPRLAATPVEFQPPGVKLPELADAGMTVADALRTFFKQGLSSPLDSTERRAGDRTALVIPYLQTLAPPLASLTSPDDIIFAWTAHERMAGYITDRCILSLAVTEDPRKHVETVLKRVGSARIRFLLPASSDLPPFIGEIPGLGSPKETALPPGLKLISF